ncbi:MAG: helix-turn-helix domain-containing protein [Clostridiales bacterium]|nr:helix-turn-helix domain-containing protein [Clostridiales bacterium]
MQIGEEIRKLRKLSGMTQEQLAEKLNVSRQALSKWENGASPPDIESMVKIAVLFRISLDELLLQREPKDKESQLQITLEDLTRINLHNRKMNILLTSGIMFLVIGVMMASFITALDSTTSAMGYILYRYIATGQYAAAPINYFKLWLPAALIFAVGVLLCAYYFIKNRKDWKKENALSLKGVLEMKNIKILAVIIGVVVVMIVGAYVLANGGKSADKKNSGLYNGIIEELGDGWQFAQEDIGEKNPVLFAADTTYDDGQGHKATIFADVYYAVDGETYNLGVIESMSTAYPISYGNKRIYAASHDRLNIYEIDTANHELKLKEQYITEYGDGDEIFYSRIKDGEEEVVYEKDYLKVYDEYTKATVVDFSYGADVSAQ